MAGDDIVDAEWEEVPDNRGALHVSRPAPRETAQRASSRQTDEAIDRSPWFSLDFWRSLPWIKATLLVVVVFVFAIILTYRDDNNPASSSQEGEPVPVPAAGDAKQMLSDWSQKVTGKASSTGVAMVNGPGERGEFCQNTKGDTLLRFGGMRASDTNEMLFDYFVEMHSGPGTELVGSFLYDPVNRMLRLHDLVEATEERPSLPDQQRPYEVVDQGIVTINGTRFHVCVL